MFLCIRHSLLRKHGKSWGLPIWQVNAVGTRKLRPPLRHVNTHNTYLTSKSSPHHQRYSQHKNMKIPCWFRQQQHSTQIHCSFSTAFVGIGPPHRRGFELTLRHTTLGTTFSLKSLAHRRDLYVTTHNTHNRQTFSRLDSNPQSQQTIGRRHAPQTVWPLRSAQIHLLTIKTVMELDHSLQWQNWCVFENRVLKETAGPEDQEDEENCTTTSFIICTVL